MTCGTAKIKTNEIKTFSAYEPKTMHIDINAIRKLLHHNGSFEKDSHHEEVGQNASMIDYFFEKGKDMIFSAVHTKDSMNLCKQTRISKKKNEKLYAKE